MTNPKNKQHPIIDVGADLIKASPGIVDLLVKIASTANITDGVINSIAQDLEKKIRSMSAYHAWFVNNDPSMMSNFDTELTGIVALAMQIGAVGPLSEAVKKLTKQPYVKGNSEGGKASGASRSKKAKEGWEAEARRLLIGAPARLAREGKSASQDNMINDTSALWTSTEFKLPSHSHVRRLIKKMQGAGELPRIEKA